ncbi:flagellar FlbD family protein [Heyndrickxia acidiproducens]|uniref:flagellar FlbD family protein n=1 Tax=Heyndrickxia acidiproducens TaxID=1121084 RepID=UPI00036DC251|nr:flagellar FlbD family protein [Heyndrickxia acidiproducens]
MILVTRLNGKTFMLNALYIETVESVPDTRITLTNGHSYIVKETSKEIEQKITAFYRSVSLFGRNLEAGGKHEK